MSNNINDNILLVGLGFMGKEYHKVLSGMGVEYTAVGRGSKRTEEFIALTGHHAYSGGIDEYVAKHGMPHTCAILAVQAEYGAECAVKLLKAGIKQLLVEKPCGLNEQQMDAIIDEAQRNNAKVVVGYNRRFYAAVMAAEKIIKEDGGVTSVCYDFTEKGFKDDESVEGLLVGNSSHVIDLAFWLGGLPKEMRSYSNIDTNSDTVRVEFSGAGVTEKDALFSYMANWKAPGRWSVEVMTAKHKLIFRPMEKLQIQDLGSFAIREDESVDYSLDTEYKHGVYREVETFLSDIDNSRLLTIEEQRKHLDYYFMIARGKELRHA